MQADRFRSFSVAATVLKGLGSDVECTNRASQSQGSERSRTVKMLICTLISMYRAIPKHVVHFDLCTVESRMGNIMVPHS